MNILIYTHAFSPLVGGIETITLQLAQRLAAGLCCPPEDVLQVTVVTPKAERDANEGAFQFRVVRAPSFVRLLKLIRNADILQVAGTDMLPLFLGWCLRKNMVVEHHGFQTACPNGQMIYKPTAALCPGHFMAGRHHRCLSCNATGGVLRSLKSWLLTFPRRWLCSQAPANVMPTTWLSTILQLPRMIMIHHGLPADKYPVSAPGAPPARIVFLGRLVSTKGVHVLLEAAHHLNDCEFRLDIIGEGPERSRLEADVRSLNLEGRVLFHGRLTTDEVHRVMANARAVVMPSLAGEVFGLVALESMLRQKVLIVSDIGSLTEVIGDAGLAFPTGDAPALANCLRQVLNSDRFAEEMGARAGLRANFLFTPERMVNDHLVLYRRLLEARRFIDSIIS
jgi:glycosyltransferase involved in cell wall biosynthesis